MLKNPQRAGGEAGWIQPAGSYSPDPPLLPAERAEAMVLLAPTRVPETAPQALPTASHLTCTCENQLRKRKKVNRGSRTEGARLRPRGHRGSASGTGSDLKGKPPAAGLLDLQRPGVTPFQGGWGKDSHACTCPPVEGAAPPTGPGGRVGERKGAGSKFSQVLPLESLGVGVPRVEDEAEGWRRCWEGTNPRHPRYRPGSLPCGILGFFWVGHPRTPRDTSHLLPSMTVHPSIHPSTYHPSVCPSPSPPPSFPSDSRPTYYWVPALCLAPGWPWRWTRRDLGEALPPGAQGTLTSDLGAFKMLSQ